MRLRRTAGTILVTLLVMTVAVPVLASGYSYADDFESGGYRGSSGSEWWTAPWTEVGESDGPGSGSVTVSDSALCTLDPCLVVQGLVGVANVGAARRIDLQPGDSAELRYDLDFPGGVLVQGSALVQASADGGSWQTLASHAPGTSGTFRVSLPNASSTIDVRFATSGLSLLGSMGVDSVVVNVASQAKTTTTAAATTTSSSTLVTVPTTLTIPTTTLTLPTTTRPSQSTTTAIGSTSATVRPPTTLGSGASPTTSAPDHSTTTVPSRSDDASTTTSTTIRTDRRPNPSPPPGANPPSPPSPPSQTAGVVTRLDPGLGAIGTGIHLQAQENLAVRFVRASEHLGFDIVANLILGAFLAWASVTGLEHRRART